MQWTQFEGNLERIKGQLLQKWGKFTDNDLSILRGKKDELIGRILHVYAVAKRDAEIQLEEFKASVKKAKKSNV